MFCLKSEIFNLNFFSKNFKSDLILIEFELYHFENSTAEAYSVNIVFYLPAFITMNKIEQSNQPLLNYTLTDNAEVTFKVSLKFCLKKTFISRKSLNLFYSGQDCTSMKV